MNLADVKAVKAPRKRRRRVGRGTGSGHGKTCGRGTKGSTSRSGAGTKPMYQGGQMPLFRRLPKRGFNNPFKKHYAVVNVGELERFEGGDTVDPDKLRESGVLRKLEDGVKVLGDGEINKPLTVVAHKFSRSAVEKIEKAGGEARLIS